MVDILIIGAGPAGIAAAITARRVGMAVMVIEKMSQNHEKICGDGLTPKSVSALSALGISVDVLKTAGANEILHSVHISDKGNHYLHYEPNTCFTLRRISLMQLLRDRAQSLGATFLYNSTYSKEMKAKTIIDASGCQGKRPANGKNLPVGKSAIMYAETSVSTDSFYFFHHKKNDNGYCWAFPLSNGAWNVGVWQENDFASLNVAYLELETKLLQKYFSQYHYLRKPHGALLGTLKGLPVISKGARTCGDVAGLCDSVSGEGISNALLSGIDVINKINSELM